MDQMCQIAESVQNLTRWTACTLLQILADTRDVTQTKKGFPVVQPNALFIDGTYYDAEGCGRSYEYRLAQNEFDFSRFDFTCAGILAFINEVTGKNYMEIEFTKRI